MGFIKNALVGIALYEATKYFIKLADRQEAGLQLEHEQNHLLSNYDTPPEENDPWKNSLANDDMRAPDS